MRAKLYPCHAIISLSFCLRGQQVLADMLEEGGSLKNKPGWQSFFFFIIIIIWDRHRPDLIRHSSQFGPQSRFHFPNHALLHHTWCHMSILQRIPTERWLKVSCWVVNLILLDQQHSRGKFNSAGDHWRKQLFQMWFLSAWQPDEHWLLKSCCAWKFYRWVGQPISQSSDDIMTSGD